MDSTYAIRNLLQDCERAARLQGWTSAKWGPTVADLEWVVDILGRKPTREEWADAGVPGVSGSDFVEDEDEDEDER